jgi:hypothetical protein
MNEEETKTVAGVIEDLKAAKPARRRMVISDFEAIVDGFADPSILKYYPNWKEEDFQKVIDALES